jgi:hypothetical protein
MADTYYGLWLHGHNRIAAIEHLSDPGEQDSSLYRLGEYLVGAHQSRHLQGLVAECPRHGDDGDLSEFISQEPDRFEPITLRHDQIRHDKLRRPLSQHVNRLSASAG